MTADVFTSPVRSFCLGVDAESSEEDHGAIVIVRLSIPEH